MRVHELAKELGISSKELLAGLAKLKVTAKGHMSTIEEDVVARIRRALTKPSVSAPKPASATGPSKRTAPAKATAVAAPPPSVAKPASPKPIAPVKPAAPAAKPAAPAHVQPSAKPAVRESQRGSAAPPTRHTAPSPAARPTGQPTAPPVAPSPAAKPPQEARPAPAQSTPAPEPVAATATASAVAVLKSLRLNFPISVKDLAMKLEVKANDLIKQLIGKGVFAGLTQLLDQAVATEVAKEFGVELSPQPTLQERIEERLAPDPSKLVLRAPVVTFMGHVDHGKTSLLDAIRQSKVAEGEAGGITQHIGAYEVVLSRGHVTFLDTPGHEAFTALRARGANVTDVVVLVVAADDGVMPQTIEAIDHAKAAEVPIVVAINKIDRPDANPDKVKQQLAQHGLAAEDWGGKTVMVPVSAKTGEGIDNLLEMLALEAELLELKADPTCPARGTVIEARLTKERGPISTLLVQQGTLHLGDFVIVGPRAGRVRAMINDRGHRVKEALPASPVEVLGLPGVPDAGDQFMVAADEKLARALVESRQDQRASRTPTPPKRVTLDDLHQRIVSGTLRELKLILKADVQGSLEAITQSLAKIETQEVTLKTIHMGVGDISESDVMLAAASDAVVIGFHVGVEPKVQVEAINQGVDIRIFKIIYELVSEIRSAIEGLLEPRTEETFLGRAEIRRLFQISKVGIVAGCMVTKGVIRRDAAIRVIRGRERLLETKIVNLKRIKDDAREVQEGQECGIALDGKADLQPGDLIEAWEFKKVARKLA
ncbi:MAG: translation initiation factor IF-2 [Candidatus Omnitrophica bacterium]|nr:translation initiation factor IF-2 [Candidatus Omnitrophota bacterium]